MGRQFGKGGRVVSRKGGMEFNDKIVLYCSREAKCKQGFTEGFDTTCMIFWIIKVTRTSVT